MESKFNGEVELYRFTEVSDATEAIGRSLNAGSILKSAAERRKR
jgi:hypothetical protein